MSYCISIRVSSARARSAATLSAEIVDAKRRNDPSLEVTYRDLAIDPVGHLSGAHLAAAQGASAETEALAPTSMSVSPHCRNSSPPT